MLSTSRRLALFTGVLGVILSFSACAKKTAAPPEVTPPPPPPAARPTVTLNATPAIIRAGESATLNWSSTNATELNLAPGIGRVAPEGSTAVSPASSTTYTINVMGPGGSAEASVRVTVTPSAPPAAPAQAAPSMEELFRANVYDAFFDFNKPDIRADAREALSKTAEFLRSYPQIRFTIEGHCDERGSTEYNLGLGERRAQAAKQFLISLGVTADRIETVSYGKEHPFCTLSNEDCWQQNRRAHFVMAK